MNNFILQKNSKNTYAGVFEFDGDTGYFYLYDLTETGHEKIIDSMHVFSGSKNNYDVEIRWNKDETLVCLYLDSIIWGAFNPTIKAKYGGFDKKGKESLSVLGNIEFK